MATIKLLKKSQTRRISMPLKKGATVTDFALQDNGDDTCTVLGVDAAGNTVDISAVVTLDPPPTSSDTSIITVDPPQGMTFAMHATGKLSTPGTPVIVTATATWQDGSTGPFAFDLPVDVVPGPVTGVVIQPGTPTTH